LFIDIVGYSKLSIDAQRAAIDELNEVVRESEQFQKAEAEARLIKIPTGDGMALVFYKSPEEPVECALEISRVLKEHPRLQLRMGVHSGPVSGVIDVNGQAKRVADDLGEYEHWRPLLHDLGECGGKHGMRMSIVNLHADEVGNPQLPKKFQALKKQRARMRWAKATAALLTLAIIVAGTAMFSRNRVRSTLAAPEKSIAVLPFENLSDEKQNAFFTDGMQDEILANLAKVADLKVISRTSVMLYKSGNPRNLREIGQQLGVAHVLEGSVQRAANRVRVMAQLIDARTDAHLWAQTYDRDLADVFAIQSDLAHEIANALQAKLSDTEKALIERKPTENGEAYLAFVQAHSLQNALEDLGKLKQSEQLYARAVELDPKFALALARYSQLESWISHNFDPTRERRQKARALAEQALQLQPDLPEAHLAKGFSYYYDDDNYEAAQKEFEIARSGLPNESEVYFAIGAIQRRQGKWAESTANLEKAASLNPKDRWSLQNLAFTYQVLRDFDRANKTIDRAIQIDPTGGGLWEIKARLAIAEKGDFSVAEKAFQTMKSTPMNDEDKLRIAGTRAEVFVLERKYKEGLREAESLPDGLLTSFPLSDKYYLIGFARKALEDETGARAAFLKAKDLIEAQLKQSPDAADVHIRLARVLAYLGQKGAALAEAQRATELLPESKDALGGPEIAIGVAEVHAVLDDNGRAIEILDGLLSRPSAVTVQGLKINPIWDPLRNDPRFQPLLNKYGGKT